MWTTTDLKYIAFSDLVARFNTLEHFLEDFGLLLNLSNLFRSLCPVVGLMPGVVSGHNLHQPIRLLQIFGAASSDKLLQLG